MPKTNKLSIYLIKQDFTELLDIVESTHEPIDIPGVGTFFFDESHPSRPKWLNDFFGITLQSNLRILSASAKGVLIAPIQEAGVTYRFAIPFGTGRHLLKEGVIEERFGLKVVLNSVAPSSLRSIAKTSLGSVSKQTQEQMSKDVSTSEFGIDIEQDLVNAITGKSNDAMLGKIITGRDSLGASVKVDATNLAPFLTHCLGRFRSEDYKTNFDWIDQINDVRNPQLRDLLNGILVSKLTSGSLEKVWMAVPEIVDWSDVKGFRYGKKVRADLHDDLDIPTFLSALDGAPISFETLQDTKVFLIQASSEEVGHTWSAFRCLYAEVDYDGKFYVLNNGKWYSIAPNFTGDVLTDFRSIPVSSLTMPECQVNDEGPYNIAASAAMDSACCMDKKLITHGGSHSKIEFCDIYTSTKKIVHVKKYGGSEALGHLFNQGVVSGELFVSESAFRHKLNAKLPDGYKLIDPSARPNPTEYEIVYAIISKVDADLDIPFFSKVSLRNARRRLSGFGYSVSLKKILKSTAPIPSVTAN